MPKHIRHAKIFHLPTIQRNTFLVAGSIILLFSMTSLFRPAHAALIGDVIRPYLDYTVTVDDNMLRIRENMDAQALFGSNKLSDISQRFSGGVILEKEISRQHLSANLNWAYTKFDRFSQINNQSNDFSGNWNWVLGNNLTGNMGGSFIKAQAPFLFQPGVKNIRTTKTGYFNAAWRFHPSWSLRGDYTRFDLESDANTPRVRFLNRVEDRFEGGIDYITANNSSVGLLFGAIIGDFPEPFLAPDGTLTDNSFDQIEVKTRINWIITGKSRLQFRGGWVERTNASFSTRDFSGINARLIYDWQPTGKIGLRLSGWREIGTAKSLTASFSLNTGVSATPTWNVSEKVRIEGDFSYETRDFSRLVSFTDDFLTGRNNDFFNASSTLAYTPYNGIEVSLIAYHRNLVSDSTRGGFNANGLSVNLRYTLGNK